MHWNRMLTGIISFIFIANPYLCQIPQCKDTCDTKPEARQCHCDQLCFEYGDCCSDVASYLHLENQKDHHGVETTHISLINRHASCQKFQNGEYYLIITSCPGEFRETTTNDKKCTQTGILPQYRDIAYSLKDTEPTPVVFSNIHCARCHGLTKNDLVAWNASLECNEPVNANDSREVIFQKCKFVQSPPDGHSLPRRCANSDVKKCPDDFTDQNLTELCNQFSRPVRLANGNLVYKNEFCAECNMKRNDLAMSFHCSETLNPPFAGPDNKFVSGGSLSLTYLLSFENDLMTLTSFSNSKLTMPLCDHGKAYSKDFKKCLNISCPSKFEFVHEQCVLKDDAIFPPKTMFIKYKMVITGRVNDSSLAEINFPVPLSRTFFHENCSFDLIDNLNFEFLDELTFLLDINIDTSAVLHYILDCLKERQLYFKRYRGLNIKIKNYRDIDSLKCPRGNLTERNSNWLLKLNEGSVDELIHERINVEDLNTSVSLFDTKFEIVTDINNLDVLVLNKLLFCVNDGLLVPHACSIYFAFQDFRIVHGDAVLYVPSSNRSLYFHSYIMENSTLYICDKNHDVFSGEVERYNTDDIPLTVCYIISILSLVVVMLIHCCMPELRNLHGKCLVSFCVALAVAQTLWVLQSRLYYIACRPLAVLSHYIWLSAFSWSFVLAYDLARKLNVRSIFTVKVQNDRSLLVKYSLSAWIVPGLLVLSCFVTDEINNREVFKYGAGESGVCWIQDNLARILSFSVVTTFILLLNFILLITVICGIEYARCVTKGVRGNKRDISRCLIYTKISLVIGVTWALSFIVAIVKIAWMATLYNIIMSLQGFLVLLSVVFNGRVLKSICRKEKPQSHTPSDKDTETTIDTHL